MTKKTVSIMAGITAASILMTACGKEVNTPGQTNSGEDNNHTSERLYTMPLVPMHQDLSQFTSAMMNSLEDLHCRSKAQVV